MTTEIPWKSNSKTDDGPDYDTRREAMHHAVTLIKGDVTYPDPGEAAVTFANHIAKYLHNGELPNND
ncbi:hypothetical protein [Glutamicibacter creatinolyticus]|uniref:hypothetical protein n=1 Tax=Glutamicibacter creatinolyticus TaxID=162496 RepID=UPI0031D0B6A9